jgi:hypothetical protein
MKKFRADRHQRDHREVLVDRGDARLHRVARAGEVHRLAFEQDLARGRLVHARHGLDEGRLAGAVVAQQAMAFARGDVDRHPASAMTEPKCFSMFFISTMGCVGRNCHLTAPP